LKIVEPSFSLSTPFNATLTRNDGVEMLRFIEKQGRISHASEDRQTDDSWERFIQAVVLQHGDWSICEHATLTATLQVDRGVSHELVRHRLFSFTQSSTRFINYAKTLSDLEFIKPQDLPRPVEADWKESIKACETTYKLMIGWGAKPQQARSILPNSFATVIAVTGNLRNFRHLFLMRTSKETHPDFRAVTIPMLEKFKQIIPLLYDDIEPNARQIENLRKAR